MPSGCMAKCRGLISRAIIDTAASGERDPAILAREGLKALGLDVDRVA
jgi:hypothetical protein